MICQLSADQMQVWGWRVPLLLAAVTALIGYWLRTGLPEPKTFLIAARAEAEAQGKAAMVDGAVPKGADMVTAAAIIVLDSSSKR